MRKFIAITTQKEGFHAYPDAPEEVAFLRNLHRHLFKIRVEIEVTHGDRELEFFLVKRYVDSITSEIFALSLSCEDYAEKIIKKLSDKYKTAARFYFVSVSEDGENEGYAIYDERAQV